MIAAFLFAAATAYAEPPLPPSMDVTIGEFAAGLEICREQIMRKSFTSTELEGQGWLELMRNVSDESGNAFVAYRHPSNMMIVAMSHKPAGQDTCSVTVPTGTEISHDSTTKIATQLLGNRKGDRWAFEQAEVVTKKNRYSIVFRFLKKESK